jgi:hypothetical protein
MLAAGTQFTCFTSTEVQMLTPAEAAEGMPQVLVQQYKY